MISIIYISIIGWLLANLANYFSDILPIKRRPGIPVCFRCGSSFSFLKYCLLTYNCNHCGYNNNIRVWIVRTCLIISALYLWWYPNEKLGFYLSILLFTFFVIIIVIDVEHRLILHPIIIVGSIFGIASGAWMHGIFSTLAGGFVGFVMMLILFYLGILVIKLRSKKHPELTENEALGFGDVNLGGVIGFILGYPAIFASLMITILSAGIVSFIYIMVMIIRREYSVNLSIPYGPFLVFGAIVLLFL